MRVVVATVAVSSPYQFLLLLIVSVVAGLSGGVVGVVVIVGVGVVFAIAGDAVDHVVVDGVCVCRCWCRCCCLGVGVDGVIHSMKRLMGDEVVLLSGQCTDIGGGGTLYALEKELNKRQMLVPNYLVASCSLHNIQTALCNGVGKVLGEGGHDKNGVLKRNCLQMLHGCYHLQNWHKHEEFERNMEVSKWRYR